MDEETIRSEFERKVRRGIFRPVRRWLRGPDAEERHAEAVALVFEEYQRAARRGVVLDDALLVHACRLRAQDPGRQLVKGGQRMRDVLDRRNRRNGRVELTALEDPALAQAARDPTAELVSRLDLERWVARLPSRDRAALAARYAGSTWIEAGRAAGSSTSSTFARLRLLGAELARRCGRGVGAT